jgi:hypothetical protein
MEFLSSKVIRMVTLTTKTTTMSTMAITSGLGFLMTWAMGWETLRATKPRFGLETICPLETCGDHLCKLS